MRQRRDHFLIGVKNGIQKCDTSGLSWSLNNIFEFARYEWASLHSDYYRVSRKTAFSQLSVKFGAFCPQASLLGVRVFKLWSVVSFSTSWVEHPKSASIVYLVLTFTSLLYFLYFRDIAQAIKYLLDAVNDAFTQINSLEDRNLLDRKKRDFVKYSKKFSTTLKDFFRDNRFVSIYTYSNHLLSIFKVALAKKPEDAVSENIVLLKFNNTCSFSIGASPTLASHSPNMSHNVFTGSFGFIWPFLWILFYFAFDYVLTWICKTTFCSSQLSSFKLLYGRHSLK